MDGCWWKTLTPHPPFFLICLSFLSPLSLSLPCSPYASLSHRTPGPPDCNNRNNDNKGDGPGDGDVKKHNIRITNTLSHQWPSADPRAHASPRAHPCMYGCACVCVCACVSLCVCESVSVSICADVFGVSPLHGIKKNVVCACVCV